MLSITPATSDLTTARAGMGWEEDLEETSRMTLW